MLPDTKITNTECSLELGVISVTFNAEPFIREFILCSLAQIHVDFLLLIIDNDSRDETVSCVRGYNDPRIHILENRTNVGYAEACNQGIKFFKKLGTKNLLFLNNDTIFPETLFSQLVIARTRYRSDAITPRINYASDPGKNWYAGGKFNYWRGFQGQHLGEGMPCNPLDTLPRYTPVAPGCCVLFSAEIFTKIGIFDPKFFVYGEDTDMFMRMLRKGRTLLYHPGIVLTHKVSLSTGGPQSDFSIHYYHRNQIYLIRKHLHPLWMPVQLILIFGKALLRLLLRKDSFRQFCLRIKGALEGFGV
jgi:GT2 family glycosyltransferase